jgi:hypothetical protein
MHGLQQIHSLNEQAARDEHNRNCQNALANGFSYVAHLDELGNIDLTKNIIEFSTAASLKAHLLASVKVIDHNKFKIVYGRNS